LGRNRIKYIFFMIFKEKSKISIFFFIIFFIFINKSLSTEPSRFVEEVVNKASQALHVSFTKEQKIAKLKIIAKESVDIRGIGLYSLGAYRKTISTEQKIKYDEIFEKYFLKTFSSRLAQYSDPKVSVKSQKILNKKYTMVSSVLVATEKRPEVKIDWRIITKDPDHPLIIDVVIEGVSLAKVQKEEFNSIIQSNDGNIDALFLNLREFISKE
tara:strand:- start:48 stop:686 length:639 start_codon:yes stop_codon:yes gene_type:complete